MLLIGPNLSPPLEIQGQRLEPDHAAPIVEARFLDVTLRGFAPDARVTIASVRPMVRWSGGAKGPWTQETVRMVAWATIRVGEDGSARLDRAPILAGSFARTGSAGLFWSGYPAGAPEIPADLPLGDATPAGDVEIRARSDRGEAAAGSVRFVEPDDVTVVPIDTPELHGCYAFPKGARRTGTLISLHGSEGGSVASARSRAIRFAARGVPTLGLNYFAWPNERIANLPAANLNTPVELLERARAWLAARPEVDPGRIGLYGVSKGAEFALVGASVFPWVRAVVAVVPSDSVWEGYPTPPRKGAESTWSLGGRPLPYIPLYDVEPGRYRVNTDRYEISRRDRPREAAAALIPLERTRARVLLLASDRDEVWASGRMARALETRMRRFGRGDRIEAHVYPLAGHQISGVGLFPVRLYGIQSEDPRDKLLDAEGEATVDADARTMRFLKRSL